MTKRKTSIQINGQHYDALTGVLLSIDGVVGGVSVKHGHQAQATATQPVKATKAARTQPVAAHAKGRHVAPSATLMRHAVAKPTNASLKRQVKVQVASPAPSQLALASQFSVMPKLSLYSLNQQRVARAEQAVMSPRVAKFARQLSSTVVQDVEQAAVKFEAAIEVPQTFATPAPTGSTTSDIFEQALLRATSHEEPAPLISTKKSRRAARSLRRRMVSFSAGAVAVLALVGAFGYQQSDSNQFRVAANQAGFAATMPSYRPTGFDIAGVNVNSGYLNVRYSNGQRTFAVAEKPSSLDSESLLDRITLSESTYGYATLQRSGRTVYVYGRNQAAWVHNGILYQVLGNGSLSNEEFVAIATSM